MFGDNEVSGPFNHLGDKLRVTEIFYTLQGEGPDAGKTAIFLRLSKCNLRCFFCDTEFETGTDYDFDVLMNEINKMRIETAARILVITGGEPLLQNIVPLVKAINLLGLPVSIETAGSVYLEGLDTLFRHDRVIFENLIVCSPKTGKVNEQLAKLVGAWKYIITDQQTSAMDGLPITSTQIPGKEMILYRPINSSAPIYVQPVDVNDKAANFANLVEARDSALVFGHILSVQMHKLAELP